MLVKKNKKAGKTKTNFRKKDSNSRYATEALESVKWQRFHVQMRQNIQTYQTKLPNVVPKQFYETIISWSWMTIRNDKSLILV